jgi:hypothetical protein
MWTDPKHKIVGVVQDLANDAVYGWGFTTSWLTPQRFYVKLDPKPQLALYALTTPVRLDHSGAYSESYHCALAFRKSVEKK